MQTNYHARARMASVVDAIIARLQAKAAVKSINEVTREYRDALENLVVDAANGNVKAGAFRTNHNTLIDELAQGVYVEGMREGGIKDAEGELDSDDEAAIRDWQLEQLGFVLGFAQDAAAVSELKGDERTAARDGMLRRVDAWVSRLNDLGSLGYARAKQGVMSYWELGETEVHCVDCKKYSDLGAHRLGWWVDKGYLPRSPDLACTGINCDCKLKSSKTDDVVYPRPF